MNCAQQRLAIDDLETDNQALQMEIFEEIHDQQDAIEIRGKCDFGCSQDCIIFAWSFSKNQKMNIVSGMDWVCKFSRVPCPHQTLSPLIQMYGAINKGCRPLTIGIVNPA